MFNHINHSIGIYIRAFLITDWRVMKAILLQLHRHSKCNSLWCLMGTYEVCTCTHLFFFTNYHIFYSQTKYFKLGKKNHNWTFSLDCKFTISVVHILYAKHCISSKNNSITFKLCKIHLEFHNTHAQFCLDVYIYRTWSYYHNITLEYM